MLGEMTCLVVECRAPYLQGSDLDLKKAFDTVDHNILISKLSAYGIRGTSIEWFKSYLSERY